MYMHIYIYMPGGQAAGALAAGEGVRAARAPRRGREPLARDLLGSVDAPLASPLALRVTPGPLSQSSGRTRGARPTTAHVLYAETVRPAMSHDRTQSRVHVHTKPQRTIVIGSFCESFGQ